MSADEAKPPRKPAKPSKAVKTASATRKAHPAAGSGTSKPAKSAQATTAKAAQPKLRKAGPPAAGGPSQVPHWDGRAAGRITVDGSTLGSIVKLKLLRNVLRAYEANQRQGTACTKTRGETNRTERKPYKQKGTGNARRGDFNSPLLRGGGVIFGPRPRDYRQSLPRRALKEALRSALLGKLRDGEVVSLTAGGFAKPSTKTAATALRELGCLRSAVVVLPERNEPVWKSFRNLPRVSVIPASDLNAHHVLAHDRLVLVDDAWARIVARLPEQRAAGANGAAEHAEHADADAGARS
jgi:large subunit ribosomal protein L4